MSKFINDSDTDNHAFIQYKGTDICLDFTCTCGESGHFDGYFAYVLECKCGLLWEMPCFIKPRLSNRPEDYGGVVKLVYDDDPQNQSIEVGSGAFDD